MGYGSSANVDISPDNPNIQVSTSSYNKPAASESQPLYLVIGEELGHALGAFDGAHIDRENKGVSTYIGNDGRGHYEKQPLEELYNHGIGIYSSRPGGTRSVYPTENSLRAEHGLNSRVAYDIVPGASEEHN
jgi:hypothetical protein